MVGQAAEGKYGDRAGEHLGMRRGRYDATAYVALGFAIVAATVGVVLLLIVACILEPPWTKSWLVDRAWREDTIKWSIVADFGVGLLVAWLAFRDRWKCVESVASRYCSGLANVSLVYVPLIAAWYGSLRGIRKLWGR